MDAIDPAIFGLHNDVALESGVGSRLVMWAPQADGWLRVASLAGAVPRELTSEANQKTAGLDAEATPMRAAPTSWWSRVTQRLGRQEEASWRTPSGEPATPADDKQKGLLLVWSMDPDAPLQEPGASTIDAVGGVVQRLGANLLLITSASLPDGQATTRIRETDETTQEPSVVRQAAAALDRARQQGDAADEIQALIDLGAALVRHGKAEPGVARLERARELAAGQGDASAARDALANLGQGYLDLRRGDEAVAAFESVLSESRGVGDRHTEKQMLSQLGTTWTLAGEPRRALEYYEPALRLAEELADRADQADLLWRMAVCRDERGDLPGAIADAERSVALLEALGSPAVEEFSQRLGQLRGGDVPPPSVSAPSTLRMALSAAAALARFTGSGFKKVAPTTREARLELCNACDQHTGVRCRACGCFTAQKTWLPHEHCPLGKWPEVG